MTNSTLKAVRTGIVLRPDCKRVFFRPFNLANRERVLKIIARVMDLSEVAAVAESANVMLAFDERHHKLRGYFLRRFEQVRDLLITDEPMSEARRLLLGAYFTQEYSLEAAALFNPSMVPHPDQSGLPVGSVRFVLSLRATGEGHVSSIVFHTGVVDREAHITLKEPSHQVTAAEVHPNSSYEKKLFEKKLFELGLLDAFAQGLLALLDETFAFAELNRVVARALRAHRAIPAEQQETARSILALARANYEVRFDPEQRFSERVIFPNSPSESKGIEDARFVAFREDDESTTYYATYTAFDGQVVLPQLLETKDFLHFKICTLNGLAVRDKGMALFPRKIHGRYAMLSRYDGENLYLMYSDMPQFWHEKQILLRPTYPWEFVQIGNCGSPIETEAGWLMLTHGVGAMRQYSIGATLLDRDDPSRVLGRLPEPLLTPNENEREGYVPNVVYCCGAMIHAGQLILPYAMSDQCSSFATVSLAELLAELLRHPPLNL
jgi:predicted GH43/DUF377 family glycosyl hydrolase